MHNDANLVAAFDSSNRLSRGNQYVDTIGIMKLPVEENLRRSAIDAAQDVVNEGETLRFWVESHGNRLPSHCLGVGPRQGLDFADL